MRTLILAICVVAFSSAAFADPEVFPPDPWYVGQTINVVGTGFPANDLFDIVITLSDDSTVEDSAVTDSSGNLVNSQTQIEGDAPGGEALIQIFLDEVELASETFEVVDTPTIVTEGPIDVENYFWIEAWGFLPYEEEDIHVSVVQGEHRLELDDNESVWSTGKVAEWSTTDEYDFFMDEVVFVFSLDDGTILASKEIEIENWAGTSPVFESELDPDIDVTPPGTFREGDEFDVDLEDGIGESAVVVEIIGDNNTIEYDYGFHETDSSGELSLTLRMPYVLGQSVAQDGRTIRVSHGGYTEDFPATLNEGIRFGLSEDTFEEGDTIEAEIRNGVGESEVIFQIVHDNEVVVHEFGYEETDGSGYGEFELTIPTVLDPEYNVDGFTFRAIHGGLLIDKSVTIEDGLRVYVGAQNVREGHDLDVTVFNGTPSTSVSIDWYLDETFVQSQSGSFSTNGAGLGEFTFTVPDVLQSMAESDFFTLEVTHDGNTFELGVTVHQSQTPDPGESQVTGLVNGNGSNTIEVDSIIGLAQLYNLGYSIDDIYLLVDSSFWSDPDFPKVLGYVADAIYYMKPLDEASIGDLVAPLDATSYGAITAVLPISDDPRYGLVQRTKHQLVILIHGQSQTDAGGSSDVGMNAVYDMVAPHIAAGHVITLESGYFFYPTSNPTANADYAYNAALDIIDDTISDLDQAGQGIDSVVIAGYSWGGGMARRVANYIDSQYGGIEISGLVYVDAVNHGAIGVETDLPSSFSSLLNIYQSEEDSGDWDFIVVGSGYIGNPGMPGFDGTAYYGRYREIDTDYYENTMSHSTIDEGTASTVKDFILNVLNEWYWDDFLN